MTSPVKISVLACSSTMSMSASGLSLLRERRRFVISTVGITTRIIAHTRFIAHPVSFINDLHNANILCRVKHRNEELLEPMFYDINKTTSNKYLFYDYAYSFYQKRNLK